jgi:hypothetical protein
MEENNIFIAATDEKKLYEAIMQMERTKHLNKMGTCRALLKVLGNKNL